MRYLRFALVAALSQPLAAQTRELSSAEQVAHVLSRLTFGARIGDVERVTAMGVDKWIAQQLRPESLSDSAAVRATASIAPWSRPITELASLAQAPIAIISRQFLDVNGNVLTGADTADRMMVKSTRVFAMSGGSAVAVQFANGKLLFAQHSDRQLYEVIVDFWENHFSIYSQKTPSAGALPTFGRDAIRPRALGKFRDLLGAVAHSPAMLFYLDNHSNTATDPNENYARELLELHTMGVDGGYTQADVATVARALSGWSIEPARPLPSPTARDTPANFIFRGDAHDSSAKMFLGHALAAGRGIEDGEEVLDIIARHPSTARYIATKLVRRLVSDDPPASLVARAAGRFTETDGDIAEVVRTIVTSNEFFSRAAFRAKVKSPFELVVSTRRILAAPPDTALAISRLLARLGQPTFGRQTPDGWPDVGVAWINSGTLMQRILLAGDIAAGTLAELPVSQWEGLNLLASKPAAEQADGVVRLILYGIATPATQTAIRAVANEDGATRLRDMLAVALGSPDFQRR